MAVLKCKMCGGDLVLNIDTTVAECEYCGTRQTVPTIDSEKKLTLFQRANRLRLACEFDKAAGVYESIISEFPEEAEAYWGLILCKYGIEYVDDPATAKKIPTCHRSSFQSLMDDSDFNKVMENSDPASRAIYREEANQIEGLRNNIIEVSSKEEPYDIFICYKETTQDGDRTLDSVIAQDVYNELTAKGYRVFFSRITLENKLGQEYEPYIFAALNSAKVMLAFGTDYEYYNSVWVKNEWSRFLQLISKGEKKTLIPCFKNIDAYDMPKEFAKLQAQDMGKVGAIQDLLRGIEKILPKQTETVKETVIVQKGSNKATTDSLLKRAFMFLEDKKWENADRYAERVLDINPECVGAYLCKFMSNLKVTTKESLKNQANPFDQNEHYKKILRYGDNALISELKGYIDYIKNRNAHNLYNQLLQNAHNAKTYTDFKNLADQFETLRGYKDSEELRKQCLYNYAAICMNSSEESKILFYISSVFDSIKPYKDSEELARSCKEKAQKNYNNEIFLEANKYMNGTDSKNWEKALSLYESIPEEKTYSQYADFIRNQIRTIKARIIYLEKYPILKEKQAIEKEYDQMQKTGKKLRKDKAWTNVCIFVLFALGIPLIIWGASIINDGLLLFIGGPAILLGISFVISAIITIGPFYFKKTPRNSSKEGIFKKKEQLDRVPAFRVEDYIK